MISFVSVPESRTAADMVYGGMGSLPTGWQIDTTFGDAGEREGESGGYVYALKPSGVDDGRRMLVFRGTEVTLTNMKDLFADVTDIGKAQYAELDEFVNPWLAQQLVAGRNVELVGHSLGGALVQWAINDTNMQDTTDPEFSSVLELARQLPDPNGPEGVPNTDFQINPNQLHFTTFNAPGITHVLGGSTPATDRTSIVVGEHHVVIGQPPLVQGDPIHLLGGPHVGATGTQLVGHQVDYSELETGFQRSGIFAHTIQVPAYWTAPVVAYTPLPLDLALAQSFARHYSQLGNTDGTVQGNTEAVFRLALYASALGVAISVGQLGKQAEAAAHLAGLEFDREIFADTLALPGVGINLALEMVSDAAKTTGANIVQIQQVVAASLLEVGRTLDGFTEQAANFVTDTLLPWITETAQGIGNAFSDLLTKIPDVLDLGRTLTFGEYRTYEQAYEQAAQDPTVDSALRSALQEARDIVQQAGQTVVIQKELGVNPFHAPGFVPDGTSSATVDEKLGEVFRLSLPFAAGTGGQQVSLRFQGPSANQLSVVTDGGVQPVDVNGTVTVLVPEGVDQVLFTLIASDEVSADATVTLSATLVDSNGDATHTTQIESVVSVKAFVGTINDRYETYNEDWSSITDPAVDVAMGTAGGFYHQTLIGGAGPDANVPGTVYGDDKFYGNGGNDSFFGGRGHDLLDGGAGNDTLFGDNIDDHVDEPWPGSPDPRSTQDGKDYLDGGAGNDRLGGGGNDDRLIGGAGDDVLWGDVYTAGRIIEQDYNEYVIQYLTGVLYPGNDVLEGGEGNDALSGDGGDDVLDGGEGDDILVGDTEQGLNLIYPTTPGDDFLTGGAGNDQLDGNAGDDVLLGGSGDDRLSGDDPGVDPSQEGDDWLEGGDGDDFLVGRGGEDTLVGGNDADVLFADAGDDTLLGGAGDDVGYGGEGEDEITAGDGADQFDGEAGDDVMFGDDGNDVLIGGDGLDELDGGADDDLLLGGADGDTLFGGEGNDELQGNEGNDLLVGDAGEDRIFGQEGDDELFGSDGDDGLRGDDGDDLIDGGLGDDILVGDADGQIGGSGGNDIVVGGVGNDTLVGGGGQDTYRFESGDGADVIVEGAGEGNRLVFGAGISPGSVIASVGPAESLILRTGGSGDAIQIVNFGTSSPVGSHPIDSFEFADGTTLTYSELAAAGLGISGGATSDTLAGTAQGDRMYGGAGQDTIYGLEGADTLVGEEGTDRLEGGADSDVLLGGVGDDILLGGTGDDRLVGAAGLDLLFGEEGTDRLEGSAGDDSLDGGAANDILIGGIGNDQLYGGDGSDIYRFNIGDGFDSVFDSGSDADTDTFLFGSGITSDSVWLSSQFGQIVINVGAGPDGIQSGSASDVFGSQTIEQFQFSDGSTVSYTDLVLRGFEIDGTEFDDVLSGTNVSDRFRGGPGNDRIEGGHGNDSYLFNRGDGIDTIMDSVSADGGNEVVFGPGVTSSDVRLDLAADQSAPSLSDLQIRLGTNGDAIHLDNFDRRNVLGLRTVESFRFADGSTLTYEQLIARGFDLTGTDGDDQLTGTNAMDRIVAGDGADVLSGGLGDDQLDGGADRDRLIGGQGNDTYLFGPGAGQDTIVEFQGSLDAIRMAPGVAPSDVVVTRNNDDLVLSLNDGADRLTVSLYFLAPPFQTELVQFADGTVWDHVFIENLTRPVISGTEGPDSLVGTIGPDRLVGLAGDDHLLGLAGNDLLDGGVGADQLIGNLGDDTYSVDDRGDVVTESSNEGIDTVQSSVTHTLDADVENLTLIGSAAIHGTGNGLDNVLIGNSGANVLMGGLGNDTYVIGAEDTVVESVGEGIDVVQTDISATLGANVENLLLTGSASLIGVGNELNNVLRADGSISVLAGGDGNDTYVIGSNGDDDTLVETATGGVDTVIAGHEYRLPANIEQLILLDPRVPDFASFSLIPYGFSEQFAAGYGNNSANILIGGRANNLLDGGLGADTFIGGDGNDTYVVDHVGDMVIEEANEGVDNVQSTVSHGLSANVENLTLVGTASINGGGNTLNNDLRGNDAPNVLDGGSGNDALLGFGGSDTYLFGRGSGHDTVFDSEATGEVDTIQFDSTVTAEDVEVYRNGFNLELAISGTPDELTLLSFFGSPEYDQKQVRFSDGTAWSRDELGARALSGNVVTGSSESETILGSDGHDLLIGSAGNDVVMGGHGKDALYGDLTFQPISGLQVIGDDTLIGGSGNDSLFDFRGNNLFDGGPGDDTLILGTGVDRVLFGRGSGVDHVTLDNNRNDIDLIAMAAEIDASNVVMTWLSPSVADIVISDSGDRLTVTLSTDWFAVGPDTTQAIVRFADGTDWNLAWSAANVGIPTATPSDDVLGAAFPASLAGLDGNDTYLLGSSGTAGIYTVVEAPEEGIDTVQSLFDYQLDPYAENLILAESRGSGLRNPERGTGNELDNFIIGNTGDNILDGGAGNDVLTGGFFRSVEEFVVFETGSDILIGGAGDDVLMADGGDIVFSADGADSEWLFLGGGSEFRSNVPRLVDDLLIGGTGNDIYIVHGQEQMVVESEYEGTDTVKSTVSYTLGEHLENLELISPPPIFDEENNLIPPPPLMGTGNELDNVMIGSEDADVLSGRTGRDTLAGGLGDDMLQGGIGHDTYLFNLGDGTDTIEDVATAGEGNRIRFGVGINRDDLTVTHDESARTLTIRVGTSGTDRLVLNEFDLSGVTGSLVAETLAFSDGTTASLAGFFGPAITEGNDAITTGGGDDVIDALGGDDLVNAGAGDDIITGGTGNDTLMGGPGNDTYVYNIGDGVDTIDDTSLPDAINELEFGAGIDPADLSLDLGSLLMRIGAGGDALHLSYFDPNNVLGPRTIETFRFADGTALSYDQLVQRGFDLTGADGNDSITGTNVVDRITALAGDDLLIGGRGNDVLMGGLGNDTYIFNIGDGSDRIEDSVLLTAGNRIQFGPGISHHDVSFTQDEAARTLTIHVGTDGTDRLVLADFDPRGTSGSLVVSALEFSDGNVMNLIDLYPPNHAPTLTVPVTNQTAAEDSPFHFTIPSTAFTDPDQIYGDDLSYEATLATGNQLPVWLAFDPITRTFSGTPGAGDAAVLEVVVTATDQGFLSVTGFFTISISGPLPQTLVGTLENDELISGRGDDTLRGLEGSDQLDGGQGDDLLDGGTGTDAMYGGPGNDTYVVDAGGDVVIESTDEGTDTVQTSLLMYTLGANLENLTLIGMRPGTGIGNALSNQLSGNSQANLLDGKAGADTMAGGAGNDLYIVDQAGDVVTEATDEGLDTVASSVTYGLGVNVENLVLTGSAPTMGIGNDLDNNLKGNSAVNVLAGLAGDDTYMIGADDLVVEEANNGTDTVVSGFTHTLAANVENLTLVGFNLIKGTGNDRANVLNGLLSRGSNTLAGGAGDDTYIIGTGDAVVEAADEGTDTVQTGETHTLGANVENLILTGTNAIDGIGNGSNNTLMGNGSSNVLTGAGGNDTLRGNVGNDRLNGGSGNDTYLFGRGDGRDLLQDKSGTTDKLLYDSGIDPLDLVISRQANDLRLAIHGSTDTVTIQNWYTGTANRTEAIQTGNGEILLSTQVDLLIQAMAAFTRQTGLTWDQAIDQQPQDVQAVLAASWQ